MKIAAIAFILFGVYMVSLGRLSTKIRSMVSNNKPTSQIYWIALWSSTLMTLLCLFGLILINLSAERPNWTFALEVDGVFFLTQIFLFFTTAQYEIKKG